MDARFEAIFDLQMAASSHEEALIYASSQEATG